MTTKTKKAREQSRVHAMKPVSERRTMLVDMTEMLEARFETISRLQFPSPKYRGDPVKFFREILGVDPWFKQVEIIDAVRDNTRVAVKSGHKVSKSHTAAGLALWFYCSFDDARVIMSSTTARQVDQILWRELRMMKARGGRCVNCPKTVPVPCVHSAMIDGEIGDLARTGLKSIDFREIVGFTAKEAEAVAGISGANLLYILDEASGISDEIFEAIEGNRAGGARIVMFSNPTRTTGEFFDAFYAKSQFYKTITVSSEETPNVVEGRIVIPGLATREWIEEKKQEWGEESPLYKVRIKGEFALKEDGKVFSIHTISEAETRWSETAGEGRLFVGLDPAGPQGFGDESVFAVRRGLKHMAFFPFRGLTEEGHLAQLMGILRQYRVSREVPVVVLDREGSVGASTYGYLRNYAELHRDAFELIAVRASDGAIRQPQIYARMRDELTANLESWIREGGAIIEDTKLEAEMHEFEWRQQQNGRLKVTPKDDIKKKLGRSPDRYDALALSVWEPLSVRDHAPKDVEEGGNKSADPYEPEDRVDPYEGTSWMGRRPG